MLNLREQVFGCQGYSNELKLSSYELEAFRTCISNHWLAVIEQYYPALYEEAKELGIERYHEIAPKIDHKQMWPKKNRVLPSQDVKQLKQLPFFSLLKEELGEFIVSDIIDNDGLHIGHEEIYWRLVRPHAESDVGPLHKDTWFHGAVNSGYGMFSKDEVTVKLWIPIYCEPGKNGLALLPGSQFREWKYHMVDSNDGILRPVPDEDLSQAGAFLIETEPGNILMFHEQILHGGVLNRGHKTRVSAEITIVLPKANFKDTITVQKCAS